MTAAFYKAYGRRQAGRAYRLHILRPDAPRGLPQSLCGADARVVQGSEPVVLDPMPATPPDGLSWCPPCIGKLAETRGVLDDVAADLAERCAA